MGAFVNCSMNIDERFAEFASAAQVQHGPLAADEKLDMIHELEAIVAHLYGLTESHLRHIFETFHEGWEYQMDLDATLKHFHAWGRRRVVALGDGRSAFG